MSAFWISPEDLSFTTDNTWQDIDVSSFVDSDATGVIVEMVNDIDAFQNKCGIRPNGSTDDNQGKLQRITTGSHIWGIIALDENYIFEALGESATINIFLWGYITDGAGYFTNGIDVTPAMTSTYTDADLSSYTGTDTPTGQFTWMNLPGGGSNQFSYARENGSTDARTNGRTDGFISFTTGVDGSELFEVWMANITTMTALCYGWLTEETATFNTNGIDRSLGSTGSYADLTALVADAVGGIYDVQRPDSSATAPWNIRKKGETSDNYYSCTPRGSWCLVECDESQVCEAKIASTSVDFYEMGYFFQSDSIRKITTSHQLIFK